MHVGFLSKNLLYEGIVKVAARLRRIELRFDILYSLICKFLWNFTDFWVSCGSENFRDNVYGKQFMLFVMKDYMF